MASRPSRSKKHSNAEKVPTPWSEFKWDNRYSAWTRYRLDHNRRYEWEYKYPDPESTATEITPASTDHSSNNYFSSTSDQYRGGAPSYVPPLDDSYGLSTLHIDSVQSGVKESVGQAEVGTVYRSPSTRPYDDGPDPYAPNPYPPADGSYRGYPDSSQTYNSAPPAANFYPPATPQYASPGVYEESQDSSQVYNSAPPIHRSQSEPTYQSKHERTIPIFVCDKWGQEKRYIALVDTGADECWISDRISDKLHVPIYDPITPTSRGAGGKEVISHGLVYLSWRRAPGGISSHEDGFNILKDDHIDIIFGYDLCKKYDLFSINTSILNPILASTAETEG